ncbi:MAG: molybdopterin synthase [Bacteroidota bacterium]|jgi:molybdopterin synthase catalytic subunit
MATTERIFLHQGPISDRKISELLQQDLCSDVIGGQALFLGRVRADILEGKSVIGIEYSAYAEMVEAEFEKILDHFLVLYPDLQQITMLHAVGMVPVGQTALLVIVSGGHRKEAFKALPAIVDEIKSKVPVWKKEILGDGSALWGANKE